jgi:hypothetical protein
MGRPKLRRRPRFVSADALHFDDEVVVDEEVDSVGGVQPMPFEGQWNDKLLNHDGAAQAQFDCEAAPVRCLKQARSQVAMHLDCGTDRPLRELVVRHAILRVSVPLWQVPDTRPSVRTETPHA